MAIATNFTQDNVTSAMADGRMSTTTQQTGMVPLFGYNSTELGTYPNDVVLLDVYNYTNDYLETIFRVRDYQQSGLDFNINVESELHRLGYLSGKYSVVARFHRNHLGSYDGDKCVIQEISTDRTEVRLIVQDGVARAGTGFNNLESYFGFGLFAANKKDVLPNLYIFNDPFSVVKVFDYVKDDITYQDSPYSIVFKLAQPLPTSFQIDSLVWVAQELSPQVTDQVTVYPPKRQLNQTFIAGPNFDIVTAGSTNNTTDYQSWDDVLSSNTDTSLALINKLFSGSLVEGVELNVDFKKFENFTRFGSAEERLRNFRYKMELLEYYDARIYNLSDAYTVNFPTSASLTGSAEFVANVLDAKTKKSNLIGGFDSYEKYLYYESSSYVSNSFGEFYPTTWPKSNSTKPYVNYSTTSSQAEEWFSGIISSASIYDLNNIHNLRRLIPEYIYISEQNEQYILFIDMIGHYFDLIYQYIAQLTSVNKRYESLTEGFAKELIYTLGHSLGLNAENGLALESLWSYFLGTNEDGSQISTVYGSSIEDRTKEVWKRIIVNLPYLLKTKGTVRGIRALINCYGIPSTILRIREYGGPEPTFYSATQEEYDQFYYGLYLSGSSTSISIPQLSGGNALEFRFRLHSSSLNNNINYEVLTGPTTISVNPGTSTVVAGGLTINDVPLSSLDTDWWTVLVNKGGRSYIGTSKYGKAIIYSSSLATATIGTTTATVPGSSARFNGYVNEFRLWSQNIDLEIYENHILAPTSYQGPQDDFTVGSTSSFDTLKIRHTFGADGKKWDISATSSISSSHPNQYVTAPVASFTNFGSNTSSYWEPQVETHYIEVVDGGPNRQIGNKIRIESGLVSASNQVYTDASILGSIQDTSPVDSPRVTVAFSPTDEVDEDINEQFGGINLDDYLGDPKDYYEDSFKGLDKLNNDYFKKYKKRNNVQGFIRLIQNYDASLFQLVKQFAPERATLHTGLVVQSHILHRNKVGQKQPSYENLYWSSSIEHDPIADADTKLLDDTIVVYDYDVMSGQETSYFGSTTYTPNIVISESLDPGTMASVETTDVAQYSSDMLILEDDVAGTNLEPSKYKYYTWYHTGSGDSDWYYGVSVGEDQWNPFQPVILDNAVSDEYTTYVDRFNNQFTTTTLGLLNQAGANMSTVLKAYGFYGTDINVVLLNGEYVIEQQPQ